MTKRIPSVVILCFFDYECETKQIQKEHNDPNCQYEMIPKQDCKMLDKIWEAVEKSSSDYIGFWEKDCKLHPFKVAEMAPHLRDEGLDVVTCFTRFVEEENGEHMVAYHDRALKKLYDGNGMKGTVLLEYCINNGKNLFGNLSCLLVKRHKLLEKRRLLINFDDQGEWFPFVFECLYDMNVVGVPQELVCIKEQRIDRRRLEKKASVFRRMLEKITEDKLLNVKNEKDFLASVYRRQINPECSIRNIISASIKKEITFFYTDRGEYYNVESIAKEAHSRGYQVFFTDDVHSKAEIGVYCQHENFPENAKFSIVLLHDMAQADAFWPDIWNVERWNDFDVAILPGEEWGERWMKCAGRYYATPRVGVYLLGYPKGDFYESPKLFSRAEELKKNLNLKYSISVLYAPSWEYGNKEEDFIRQIQSMEVNLLIKQASWDKEHMFITENIEKMRKSHEGKYDNVYYIEPEENIMTALVLCDLIVSDESSVMTEGLLFGKPSIAVMDWEIPDVSPPRKAYFPGEYVYKCNKKQLRKTVEQVLKEVKGGDKISHMGERFFNNQGNCNKDIVNLIDYFVDEGKEDGFLQHELIPRYMPYTFLGS